MIDVITLAIIKKWIKDSAGGTVTPEEIQEAVDNYLEEHPVQPTPIDDTLTIEGEAADAKAVGDAIKELNIESLREAILELQEELENLRQIIIDTTQETDVASGIVDSGTDTLTSEEVAESYDSALI